jgi:hypothetical protein
MKKHSARFKILILFTFTITGFYCSKKNTNPVGAEYYANAGLGSEQYISLYAASNDTSYQVPVSLADSPYLYIGQNQDINAQCILRFPIIDTDGTIDSAKILLHLRDIQPKNGLQSTVLVREVTQSWDEEIANDAFNDGMLGNDLFTITQIDTTSDSLFIPLEVDLITQWRDTTAESNYGIHMSTSDNTLLQLYAYESASSTSATPQLWLYFHEDSTRNPQKVTYAEDVTFTSTSIEPVPDKLVVENGTAIRSVLMFDFESIPVNATINKATLILSVDTLQAISDLTSEMGLYAYNLSDESWSFNDMAYDSSYAAVGFVIDETAEIEMTQLAQILVSNYIGGHGLLIKGSSETTLLTKAVFNSTAADSSLQPRLDIYYSLPPR